MKIEFNDVIPNPIKNEMSLTGELWGKKVEFNSFENTIIDAHSGKGKSTFTSLVAGLRFDYEGEILIDNRNIRSISKNEWSELRRVNIAYIFQDLQLFEKLKVKENLLIKNRLTDFKQESEIKEFLELFGLENKWNQECGTLSLGQQQRIAIIRSLLQPAKFLIMDEPFSHLDELNINIALNLILNQTKSNKTGVILTTLGQHYNIEWHKKVQIG
jgi:putative ABC transport system ATP-binding protein